MRLVYKIDNEHLWNTHAVAWKIMIYKRNDSSMSETLDEEVDYGSFDIDAIPHTDSGHAWSTHENDSQD